MKRSVLLAVVALVAVALTGVAVAEGAGGDQEVYDIQKSARGAARKEKLEFAQEMGLTQEHMRTIFRTKGALHRMQEELRRDLEAMAVMLQGPGAEEDKLAAVEAYLSRREEILAKQAEMELKLLETIGAHDDPMKVAALMVMGVLDSGRRVLCSVHSGVAGGAPPDLHHNEALHGLTQPLGTN